MMKEASGHMEKFPQRPLIRKLGTIECNNIVETTPIVFKGELYRFEVVRSKSFTAENANPDWYQLGDEPCLRFVHVYSRQSTPLFAEGHTFGFPIVVDDMMYVVTGKNNYWGSEGLVFYRSRDLVHWEEYARHDMPGWQIFNMNIAKKDGEYVLMIEISAPAEEAGPIPFTFRFLKSTDMIHWTLTPGECVFQKDRYAGSPAIYAFDDDPYFYVGYLEEYPGWHFANCLARSKDLIHWEYSPINPVLMYDEAMDKQIASPFLTPGDRARIKASLDINNSDMEMCEYLGRTIIYYSWGDQKGTEFLAEACYEGGMHELLTAFFEPRD